MEHLQAELDSLRVELLQMFELAHSQLSKAQRALLENNKPVLKELEHTEKLVNAKELQIDSRCETILALFTPVAVDLRFVLSALKINMNLERIGDLADGIGRTMSHSRGAFDEGFLNRADARGAFAASFDMFRCLLTAFENEDTLLAREVFGKDKKIDEITERAISTAEDFARQNPENLSQAIQLLSIIKMIERVGDHIKNIAEEIIFYSEARVLKHGRANNGPL